MTLYDKLIRKEERLSVIGLGYVGIPVAVAFAKKLNVIGFDLNSNKIHIYKSGTDPTLEVGNEAIAKTSIEFTNNERRLQDARFHIVTVPTPLNDDRTPDLYPLKTASSIVGRNLKRNSVVVFESTVYPGVTEDICVPILEKESGLRCGSDFKVGYSPERINPGDKEHQLETVTKVVSAVDEEALDCIEKVYELVIDAGIYRAESIQVAEAAKLIENCQRDINIAFMNELSIIFNKLGIDTKAVLETAGTKWNFLHFHPGLVGGHCIGIDPYYLTFKAETVGYHSQVILSGRRINDDMGRYVATMCVKKLVQSDKAVKGAKVAILGITFKENCPDVRNTKAVDIINELKEYGINTVVADPMADKDKVKVLYNLNVSDLDSVRGADAVILCVPHEEYINLKKEDVDALYGEGENVLLDLRGILDKEEYEAAGYNYWRL